MFDRLNQARDPEAAYLAVRTLALTSEGSSFLITSKTLSMHSGLTEARCRQILAALVADGYLSGVRKFSNRHLDMSQLTDWARIAEGVFGSALGPREAVMSGTGRDLLLSSAAAYMVFDGGQEGSLLTWIPLLGAIINGSANPYLLSMVSELVPSGFLRMVWATDWEDRLPGAMSNIIHAICSGNVEEARQRNSEIWERILVNLKRWVEYRSKGLCLFDRLEIRGAREPSIAGEHRLLTRHLDERLLPLLRAG